VNNMGQQTIRVKVNGQRYDVNVVRDVESGGYVAEAKGLPGCITQGETIAEIRSMASDAIACWLDARDSLARRGILLPHKTTGRGDA
jgi:predicted RNase H-like HicB family nuclease